MASTTSKSWSVGTLTYGSAGLIALFFWLLFGDFAWSMRDRSVTPMSQWYLNQIGVPNILFGILITSFPALLGLVLGPIISVKSDHHRGRWGRRIPFLLVTTPIAAAGMIGIAVTPFISRWVHSHFPDQSEMMVAVICFGVFWGAFEFATIAGQSVFGGLINDVVPKEMLGRFYGLFRAISLLDGIIFNFWIMGKVPSHFTLILLIIGIVYGTCFMWMCFKVKEGEYPPPPPRPKTSVGGIKLYFKECFGRGYYVSIYLFTTTASLATASVNIFVLPYANSLNVSMDTYGKCLALTYIISLSLSYFIGWLVDRFHPLRMVTVIMVLYTVATALGSIFATTQTAFLICWVTHGVLSGAFFTALATIGQRLFPHEKFAQYNSANGLVFSPLVMLLAPLLGLLIDITGNNYRYSFAVAAVLALISLGLAIIVYRQFVRYGGIKSYVAPE